MGLEAELQEARELSVAESADAVGSIGFECTLWGACCKAVETHDGDREGPKRAHESEGLGRESDRRDAEDLAAALQDRAVRQLEVTIAVREAHESRPEVDGVVVHDSEGPKRPVDTPLDGR